MNELISIFSLILVEPGEGNPRQPISNLYPAFCEEESLEWACIVKSDNCPMVLHLLNEDKTDGVYYTCMPILQIKVEDILNGR